MKRHNIMYDWYFFTIQMCYIFFKSNTADVNDLCQFVNGIGALNEDQKVATFKLLNDCGVTVESLDALDNDDLKTMGVPFPVWKPLLAGIANPGNPVSLLEVTMFQKLFQFVNNIGALNEDQKEATFKLLNV